MLSAVVLLAPPFDVHPSRGTTPGRRSAEVGRVLDALAHHCLPVLAHGVQQGHLWFATASPDQMRRLLPSLAPHALGKIEVRDARPLLPSVVMKGRLSAAVSKPFGIVSPDTVARLKPVIDCESRSNPVKLVKISRRKCWCAAWCQPQRRRSHQPGCRCRRRLRRCSWQCGRCRHGIRRRTGGPTRLACFYLVFARCGSLEHLLSAKSQ